MPATEVRRERGSGLAHDCPARSAFRPRRRDASHHAVRERHPDGPPWLKMSLSGDAHARATGADAAIPNRSLAVKALSRLDRRLSLLWSVPRSRQVERRERWAFADELRDRQRVRCGTCLGSGPCPTGMSASAAKAARSPVKLGEARSGGSRQPPIVVRGDPHARQCNPGIYPLKCPCVVQSLPCSQYTEATPSVTWWT